MTYKKTYTLAFAGVLITFLTSRAFAAANAFNPDTSLSILSLYSHSSQNSIATNGFSLEEVEMQFSADIDPYVRGVALFSVSRPAPVPGSAYPDYTIDPEEVFAESLSIPMLTLRVGKFKTAIGKHNMLHTHAYPFLDAPLIHQAVLGIEGWNDVGISGALLLPWAPWFSEITLQALSGENAYLFNSPNKDNLASAFHLKNLIDINDSTTFEVGVSDGFGSNQFGAGTNIFGTDLTLKYRPVEGGKYQSLLWAAEYLLARRGRVAGLGENLDGLGTWVLYQFAERWSAGLRYDVLGLWNKVNAPLPSNLNPAAGSNSSQRVSAILGFSPSEFSGLRLQYDHGVGSENKIALQLNLTMGVHPAHSY